METVNFLGGTMYYSQHNYMLAMVVMLAMLALGQRITEYVFRDA